MGDEGAAEAEEKTEEAGEAGLESEDDGVSMLKERLSDGGAEDGGGEIKSLSKCVCAMMIRYGFFIFFLAVNCAQA